MRYLNAAPKEAIEILEDEAEPARLSDGQRSIAVALLTDERMSEAWTKLTAHPERSAFTSIPLGSEYRGIFFFSMVLSSHQRATNPHPWEEMTRAEHAKWVDKLDRLVESVDSHLRSGPPYGPSNLRSHVPFETILEIRGESGSEELPQRPWDVEWSLVDSMKLYASSARGEVLGDQWMKRPRHPKATRERFIFSLSEACKAVFGELLQEVVAITASVVLSDEAINARYVRRVINENLYRQDSSKIK